MREELSHESIPVHGLFMVPTKNEAPRYLTQIAEPGAIHSCYPTSLLNGSIHQGYLTYKQAPDQLFALIRERYGVTIPFDTFGTRSIDQPLLKRFLFSRMQHHHVGVISYREHSRLAGTKETVTS